MSAIHGIFKFGGGDVSARDIERQSNVLAHRGPDGRKVWREGPIGLGHLLMRVTAEDAFDAQPVHDKKAGISLVADVRLDNREKLADALAIDEADLGRLSDSALLLRAYLRWGADCVDHLLGDFTFAAWDSGRNTLTIARDAMGQRPFSYHLGRDFFTFASEPKALWAIPEVPRKLSDVGMARIMFFAFRDDQHLAEYDEASQFEGIFGLHGGSVMTVTATGPITKRRYWTPHADPAHLGHDEAYYVQAYRRVLGEAVACRLRRNVHPAALLLGGGFDSSAIAGLAGPVVTAKNQKLVGVASVLPESVPDRPGNARKWVAMLARDMPHLEVHYVTREGLDIFKGLTERIVQAGGIHGPHGYVNEALWKTARAAGARVAMDGFGGDYTLNPRTPAWLPRILLSGNLRRFMAEVRARRRHSGHSLRRILYRDVVWPLLPPWLAGPLQQYRRGLSPLAPIAPVSADYLRRLQQQGARPIQLYTVSRLGDLKKLRARVISTHQSGGNSIRTAAHGMEFTAPYHDKRVVELALAIPEELFAKNGRTRHLARAALKDIYPREFERRGSENDDRVPDHLEMVERVRPRLLSEIDRMQREARLTRYFDFDRMRTMLTGRNARNKVTTGLAVRSFLHACAIEWFQRDNRGREL